MNNLAAYIDHTLLKPEATKDDIITLCNEALKYHFATVCVNPQWVPVAAEKLKDSSVGITTVIGFPLGATTTLVKVAEAKEAIANGATEIDMVIAIGALKSGDEQYVYDDIKQVVHAAKNRAIVKVIIETALLTDEEKQLTCKIAKEAGADFVKTSTGFAKGGATVEDIQLMRKVVGEELGVKASGGIRDRKTAEAMIAAGASRIGASSGIAIVLGKQSNSSY